MMKRVNNLKQRAWPVLMRAFLVDQNAHVSHITLGYRDQLEEFCPHWMNLSRVTHSHLLFLFFLCTACLTCLSIYFGSRFWSSDHRGDCISNGGTVGWLWDDGHRGLYPLATMITYEPGLRELISFLVEFKGLNQSASLLNSCAPAPHFKCTSGDKVEPWENTVFGFSAWWCTEQQLMSPCTNK